MRLTRFLKRRCELDLIFCQRIEKEEEEGEEEEEEKEEEEEEENQISGSTTGAGLCSIFCKARGEKTENNSFCRSL